MTLCFRTPKIVSSINYTPPQKLAQRNESAPIRSGFFADKNFSGVRFAYNAITMWCLCSAASSTDRRSDADFEPRRIVQAVLTRTLEIGGGPGRMRDVRRMVALAAWLGNDDLDAAEHALRSRPARNELRRLRAAYGLVSEARGSGTAVTLSRICLCFPAHACAYHHRIGGVRRVMAFPAFAYLIPDRDEEYCRLLRDAHMFYRYEDWTLQFPRSSSAVETVALISRFTLTAIRNSHVNHGEQIIALRRFGLVSDVPMVLNEMSAAADKWHSLEAWAVGLLYSGLPETAKTCFRRCTYDERTESTPPILFS